MAATQGDDANNLQEEEEEEEEEKNMLLLPNDDIPESYQNSPKQTMLDKNIDNVLNDDIDNVPYEYDDDDYNEEHKIEKREKEDVSHSSFLICRITIFMYAFVSILIVNYFPDSSEISAYSSGYFKFFMSICIIACIIGMVGVYLNKPKLIFACWIMLMIATILTGLLVLAYLLNSSEGIQNESHIRCHAYANNTDDTEFLQNYDPKTCMDNMSKQLHWTVIGLFVIYVISSSFGIHIIHTTEKKIQLILKQQESEIVDDELSEFSEEQQLDDSDEYEPIPDEQYDDDFSQKKNN